MAQKLFPRNPFVPRGIALASFPRSGNTWVRKLLEDLSGTPTGSIYKDRVMPRGRTGVAIKTHTTDCHRYRGAIILVRNPLDSLYSGYMHQIDIVGKEPPEWAGFVKAQVGRLKNHSEHWLNAPIPKIIVRYEDMLQHTDRELRRIALFASVPFTSESLRKVIDDNTLNKLKTTGGNLEQRFFRKGIIGDGFGKFSDDEMAFMRNELKDFIDTLDYEEYLITTPIDEPADAQSVTQSA